MVRTLDEALAKMVCLSLPRGFSDIWSGDLPESIRDECCRPDRYFEILGDLEGRFHRTPSFVPLWEENLEAIVGFDEITGEYVRYHYFRGFHEEVLGDTYQRFITSFFLDLIDSGIWEELEELAGLFAYDHLNELKTFSESTSDESYEDDYRQFMVSVS